MGHSSQLKKIHRDAIPQALEKAELYRSLNMPEQAESICLDILAIDPAHQRALVVLILALTDQFGDPGGERRASTSRDFLERVTDGYQRAYYAGIICEREARASLRRGMPRRFANYGLLQAMEWYEKAEQIRPPSNDDPILRWNSCLRTIRREGLGSAEGEQGEPLLE